MAFTKVCVRFSRKSRLDIRSISCGKRLTKLFLVFSLCVAVSIEGQKPNVAAKPPMGWNSWNHFGEHVTDADVRAAADAMVASGMREAGYTYVNIDDTWEGPRDTNGQITSNSRFPDMKGLADYLHSKGLKLGVYSSPGKKTCVKNGAKERVYEGSYGHEEQDAKTYASWGVDYLKYDLCSLRDDMRAAPTKEAGDEMMKAAYRRMSEAIRLTGRPIVLSMCQYGLDGVWTWGASVGGNLWRTTGDITDRYPRMSEIGFGQAGLAPYAGPGHWNDPDMLEVGNGGMNFEEYKTHMSLWAILAAPLLAGNDLTHMSAETVGLLTNQDVIAIDQDPAGVQGDRFSAVGPIEVWVKPLADGSKAIAVFNRNSNEMPVAVEFGKMGLTARATARDLWSGESMDHLPATWHTSLIGHSVILLRAKP